MKRRKLTIVTLHFKYGHTKSFMVPGTYDEQTGKTKISRDTLDALKKNCGATENTTFSIG